MMNEAPEKPTLLTSFHVDREMWARFNEVAERNHRSRGAELRVMIERAVIESDRLRSKP